METLVNIFMHQCRWTEAEWFYTQSSKVFDHLHGGYHLNPLHSAFKLSHIYDKQGRPKEAKTIHQDTLDLYKKFFSVNKVGKRTRFWKSWPIIIMTPVH